MSTNETASTAQPIFGDKLYQERARAALPLLVRQALAQQRIYYAELAAELGMPYSLNLNFVLGSIGQTLIDLGSRWGTEIPPIQLIVVNQAHGLPGEGVGCFISKSDYAALPKRQQRLIVDAQLQRIFAYPRWLEVLENLGLKPATTSYSTLIDEARKGGGGESEHHAQLKEHIATNPTLVGLPEKADRGTTEYRLASGDSVDVAFRNKSELFLVEVKSHISDDADLVRGMFQCVKYQAVAEAMLLSKARTADVRTALVTARQFPAALVPLKNVLGVEVIEIRTPQRLLKTEQTGHAA